MKKKQLQNMKFDENSDIINNFLKIIKRNFFFWGFGFARKWNFKKSYNCIISKNINFIF